MLYHTLTDPKDIEQWLLSQKIWGYTVNPDSSVDVATNVRLYMRDLSFIPVRFGRVDGFFDCSGNQLKTLENTPMEVADNFDCSENLLVSLEGGPKTVKSAYLCVNNQLKNLLGAPEKIGRHFQCGQNKLLTLEGAPTEIMGNFNCHDNLLTSLQYGPRRVGGQYGCTSNQISTLLYCPEEVGYIWQGLDNPLAFLGSTKDFATIFRYHQEVVRIHQEKEKLDKTITQQSEARSIDNIEKIKI